MPMLIADEHRLDHTVLPSLGNFDFDYQLFKNQYTLAFLYRYIIQNLSRILKVADYFTDRPVQIVVLNIVCFHFISSKNVNKQRLSIAKEILN